MKYKKIIIIMVIAIIIIVAIVLITNNKMKITSEKNNNTEENEDGRIYYSHPINDDYSSDGDLVLGCNIQEGEINFVNYDEFIKDNEEKETKYRIQIILAKDENGKIKIAVNGCEGCILKTNNTYSIDDESGNLVCNSCGTKINISDIENKQNNGHNPIQIDYTLENEQVIIKNETLKQAVCKYYDIK